MQPKHTKRGGSPNRQRGAGFRLARLSWLLIVALALSSLALLSPNLEVIHELRFPGFFAGLAGALGYSSVALLILSHQPRHGMGWLLMALGLVASLASFAQMYAIYGLLVSDARPLPGGWLAGWLSIWIIYPFFPTGIALPYLLFPDGHLPSQRWIPVGWMAALGIVAISVAEMVNPGPVGIYLADRPITLPMSNPTALALPSSVTESLAIGWLLAVFTLVASMAAPISRFRRASGVERRQLKWFVYFGALIASMFPMSFLVGSFFADIAILLAVLLLPLATAIAIVRHQLYDIDLIIKRTILYGALTLTLATVYGGSVALLQALFTLISGQRTPVAIVVSTLFIAALFSPLRRKLQRYIDRRFYRQRYNAELVLETFAQISRDNVDIDELAAQLYQAVASTVQPSFYFLWLREERQVS